MNGQEHYREAENCLEQARGVDFEHAAFLHREAQVHATLALAASHEPMKVQLTVTPGSLIERGREIQEAARRCEAAG